MEEKTKNYYLGLDIGTESVGWAVTDENYKLIRHGGKSLWGVRLFSPALTAAARRLQRTSRRRIERRKERLVLLQSLFAPVINPIDPSFFARLEESNLYQEDKSTKTRFSLFADKDFNDADFHRAYPTVYHLRRAMLTADDPDPRLVYLALHHMVKYRGHFLIEGDTLSQVDNIDEPLAVINQYLSEHDIPTLHTAGVDEIKQALTLPKLTQRKIELARLTGASDKRAKALLDLIAGAAVDDNKIFEAIDKKDKAKIDFNGDWETAESEWQDKLGDDFVLIQNAKLLFDYGKLKQLLGNERFISAGMVAKYDKHKADLVSLKKAMRKYLPDRYDAMFGAPLGKECNYTAYSGKFDFGARGTKPVESEVKDRTQEDFGKYVKKVLSSSSDAMQDPLVQAMLADIEAGTFMPKQVSKANAVLPYQCNLVEMQAILAHVACYPRYTFLADKDSDGVSVEDKILSLLKFRMPYYVGPVNNHSGKYWVVRRQDGKVYPWNIEQKLDLETTERKFIERMTNDCPYVPGAKVLPRNSLLYEEASALNLINKIRLNGALIPHEIKCALSDYLATPLNNGAPISKLSKSALKRWLKEEGYVSDAESKTLVVEGVDEDITACRRTYAQMCKIMGGKEVVERHRDLLETVILWSTIAGPEKSNLRKQLYRFSRENGNFLSDAQIKALVGLSLKGWGRYSRELLTDKYGIDPDTGEMGAVSVMDMLRQTNCNLSELLKDPDYGFVDALDALRSSPDGAIGYSTIEGLYCSPSVKKQIWQAVQVVNEIKKVAGHHPLKVFVEMARGDDPKEAAKREGRRNLERKQKLQKALDKLAKEHKELFSKDIAERLENLSPKDLQQNKLFLYFMQNGIDAYTGERIDYNNLRAYDRDHIYPRSKIKDDSIHDNLVLTYHEQNVKKADVYPLPREVQERMRPIWKVWLDCELITKEKYQRLTRTTPLSEDECAEFVNRQLVETRQSTKEVCKLLKQIFPDSEIVYSKASLVSDFRQDNQLVKVRDINDIHHAKDAYLNIVVGNVYNTIFGHNAKVYFARHDVDHVALSKLFERNTPGAWVAGEEGTLSRVRQVMGTNAILFTRESREQTGGLFNATLYPKGGAGLVPLKSKADGKFALMSDTDKYGGYNSETRQYYMLVQHLKKKVPAYTLVGVVARLAPTLIDDQRRREYCQALWYVDPIILIPKIKIDTMFAFGEALVSLSGMTGDRIVWKLAMQHGYTATCERYLKKVYNALRKNKERKGDYVLDEEDGIDEQTNLELYDELLSTLSRPQYQALPPLRSYTTKLLSLWDKFVALPAMQQCVALSEVIAELKCDAQASDLSVFEEGKTVGKIMISKTFDDLNGKYIIHRSITGIFEQRIPLADYLPKR